MSPTPRTLIGNTGTGNKTNVMMKLDGTFKDNLTLRVTGLPVILGAVGYNDQDSFIVGTGATLTVEPVRS